MARLNIGGSSSTCGNCGRSANPQERGHYFMLGYGSTNGKPGCGEPWTEACLTYYYRDEDIAEVIDNTWFDDFIKNLLREFHLKGE